MTDSLADWLQRLELMHPHSIELGLGRCGAVFQAMGSPSPAARIITVAGTNGKGSMVAYLNGILTAAGFHCGTYTSPHLIRFNERLKIQDVPVPDLQWIRAFEQIEAVRNGVSLTYFEFTTLAAFRMMHEAGLDFAILEVGLGGRLDAVNLVDPHCAVITAIGLDHQEYLGPDRETIGFEKAGIMRAETPVICSDRQPPDSVMARAKELQAPLALLGRDFDFTRKNSVMEYRGLARTVCVPVPRMPGLHQLGNLAAALAVIETVQADCLEQETKLEQGIQSVCLAGRLSGAGTDDRILVDVGHNPLAAETVAQYLADQPPADTVCVLAMLKDKDAEGVVQALDPWIHGWYCAGLEGARGQSGQALGRRVSGALPGARIRMFSTVDDALAAAMADTGPDQRILVFGSFFTAAAALRTLES